MALLTQKRILVVGMEGDGTNALIDLLLGSGYFSYIALDEKKALDLIYGEPPDLIIIDMEREGLCPRWQVVAELKEDNIYGHLPIIAIMPKGASRCGIDWQSLKVDDFLLRPFSSEELLLRVDLALSRVTRELDANPLTRLPGNNSIITEIERRIGRGDLFAMAYLDIDNFKPFNDKYGFSRGDEVLRMAARLIANVVRASGGEDHFVGHVGGDDFVFIVRPGLVDEACKQIIANFDLIVPTFYDEADRIRGYIESLDRSGAPMRFPIMTVSIAVTSNEDRRLMHYGEVSEIASRLKKFAKSMTGSNYVKERRSAAAPKA